VAYAPQQLGVVLGPQEDIGVVPGDTALDCGQNDQNDITDSGDSKKPS
jgi:hypothetical protein